MGTRRASTFLDLTPRDLTGLAGLALPGRDQVELALVERTLQPFPSEVQAQCEHETTSVERHIEISVNTLIDLLQVRLGRDYWLYAVFNCGGTPEVHPVQDPARLGWEAVMAVEHNRIGVAELVGPAQ
jgi:hypothetical protein